MRDLNIKPVHYLITLFITLVILMSAGGHSVLAQPPRQWAIDQRVPGYLDDTFTPYLIADQNRTVHAFTNQWIDDGGRRQAIIYRRWTLVGGWTRPVDILLAPTGNANFLSAFLDSFGMIHAIFANTNLIYYASAPADIADGVSAWSEPVVIGSGISGVYSAAISGDGLGNLALIFSGNLEGSGVYAMQSSDSGQTWTDPLPIFLTQDDELIPFSLRLVAGTDQQFRAVWNVVTNLGMDESLHFSAYDASTEKWSKPVELDRRIDLAGYFGPSFPVLSDNGNKIVVIYNGGNPFAGKPVEPGRPVQRSIQSSDGGKTWSSPVNPFPFLLGRSGEHSMSLDGTGRPHTLFVQRAESNVNGKYSIIGGIWHSVFEKGSWSNPERFVTTYSPHDVRSVIVQGNVLLAVWREDPGEGTHGIWFSYLVLDLPETPLATLPALHALDPTSQAATAQPLEVNALPTPTRIKLTDTEPGSSTDVNPAAPFAYSMVVVILVLAGVIFIYRLRRMNP